MTIKTIVEKVAEYLAKYCSEKLTGQLIFTLHFRDGGIAKTEVEIKHNLIES
jgi:hypothetical protein